MKCVPAYMERLPNFEYATLQSKVHAFGDVSKTVTQTCSLDGEIIFNENCVKTGLVTNPHRLRNTAHAAFQFRTLLSLPPHS